MNQGKRAIEYRSESDERPRPTPPQYRYICADCGDMYFLESKEEGVHLCRTCLDKFGEPY